MLFVLTPSTMISTVKLDNSYYVLDTEDLVVEKTEREVIVDCLRNGMKFGNAYYVGNDFIIKFYTFRTYLESSGNAVIRCLRGGFQYSETRGYVFKGRAGNQLWRRSDKSLCELFYGDTWLATIEAMNMSAPTVVYFYRLQDYIVSRITYNAMAAHAGILLTLILSLQGKVIDVLVDTQQTSRIIDVCKSADPLFSAKFKTMWARRI